MFLGKLIHLSLIGYYFDPIVPDGIVLSILKERLCQLDCQTRGWVLTGYPRSQEQAEQLKKAGLTPTRLALFLGVQQYL